MKAQCPNPAINEKLLLFLDGQLDETIRDVVKRHVQECLTCSDELHRLQEIAAVLKVFPSALAEVPEGPCLAPELLISLAAGGRRLPAEDQLKGHLAACTTCQGEYQALLELENAIQTDALQAIAISGERAFLSRAADAYPRTQAEPRVLVSLGNTVQRIAGWLADLLAPAFQPQPVLVRKGRRQKQGTIKIIRDITHGIGLRIEIEECGSSTVNILVFLYQTRGKQPLKNTRVSLYFKTRELVSLFVKEGRASFRNIPQGTYELALLRQSEEIKRVQFSTS